ncbi:MAG: alanine racemase, partial [Planctomycetes bacterium]|nr:alanine racemase [Planctomycetota bacterium]
NILAENGYLDYGENRIEHASLMNERKAHPQTVIHCIGRVQSRQLSAWVKISDYMHSLHSIDHVPKLAKACQQQQKRMSVFCQVNTSGEASKAGIIPDDISQMKDVCAQYTEHIDFIGLMCMAPKRDGENDTVVQKCFADLYQCAQQHNIPRLSMGMSGDYELAIKEGATDLRIGSSFFA